MNNGRFGYNKYYLSYSAWNLWLRNKDEYRRIYYEGGKKMETKETIFGKQIAEILEKTDLLSHVKHYELQEHPIEVEVEGVKLVGYLDTFDPILCAFGEHKTGHLTKDGKAPWDRVKVAQHKQLDWYSFLIKTKYKRVTNRVFLNWLETEFMDKEIEFNGHKLKSKSQELRLTGRVETFYRSIYEWQREKIKKEILEVAYEIEKDYQEYCSRKAGETQPQTTPAI